MRPALAERVDEVGQDRPELVGARQVARALVLGDDLAEHLFRRADLEDALDEVASITQIRLLNELYYGLGQLRAAGLEHDVKRAIQDLRDIWNRYIDSTNRPAGLKFQVDPVEDQVQ